MNRHVLPVAAALVCAAAPRVFAQGATEQSPAAATTTVDPALLQQARTLFEDGKRLLDQGRYADALLAYERAYALTPREEVLFALAYTHHQKYIADTDPANLRRAVKLYRDYLGMPRRAKQQKRVIEALGQLEPQVRRLDEDAARNVVVEQPAPPPAPTVLIVSAAVETAQVTVDGVSYESPAVVTTTPGRHQVAVTAPGYKPASRDAVAVENETVSVDVPLEELPGSLVVRSDAEATLLVNGKVAGSVGEPLELQAGRYRINVLRRGRQAGVQDVTIVRDGHVAIDVPLKLTTQRRASRYVLIGAGGLLVTSGVMASIAWLAQSDAQDLDARVAAGATLTESDRKSYNAAIDRRDTWRKGAGFVAGASVVVAITGVLLYLFDDPRADTQLPPVVPTTTGDSIGAAIGGRF